MKSIKILIRKNINALYHYFIVCVASVILCIKSLAAEKPTEGFNVKVENIETVKLAELLYKQGEEYFEEDKNKQAFDRYLKSAELGHVESMTALSYLYFRGKGTEKDYIQSAALAKVAATHRSVKGAAMLGICYKSGAGVIKNHTIAYFWLSVSRHFRSDDTAREELSRIIEEIKIHVDFLDREIADEQITQWINGEINDQNIRDERIRRLEQYSKLPNPNRTTHGHPVPESTDNNESLKKIQQNTDLLLSELEKVKEDQIQREHEELGRKMDDWAREKLLRDIYEQGKSQ